MMGGMYMNRLSGQNYFALKIAPMISKAYAMEWGRLTPYAALTLTPSFRLGEAANGLLCSQAGIPVAAADKKFLEAYKKKFNADPILYSPFTYDAANMLIEAMKKANSPDPAKYLPELAKLDYNGATGKIAFDEKGDRKDSEMTIFVMKGGKIEPIAVIKGGKTIPIADFIQSMAAAAPVPGPAPVAEPPKPAAEPAKDAPKAEAAKK